MPWELTPMLTESKKKSDMILTKIEKWDETLVKITNSYTHLREDVTLEHITNDGTLNPTPAKKMNPTASPLPSMRSSCPWEPTKVLERKGAKSTMISRSKGDTDPKAISNFCVSEASREGVGMGRSEWRNGLMFRSSGRWCLTAVTGSGILDGEESTEIWPDSWLSGCDKVCCGGNVCCDNCDCDWGCWLGRGCVCNWDISPISVTP